MTDPTIALGVDVASLVPIARPLPEESIAATSLPRDHPAWSRDLVAVSSRTKALLATMRPLIVRVATFWEHRVRSITIGTRALALDAAGCYRLSS